MRLRLLTLITSVGFFSVLGAEVKLKGTTITGRDIPSSGVEFFGGLPYAEPPVGNLRFRVPVLKKKLDGRSFNATQFGKACLQPALFSTRPAEDQSEDCLNVNIYRPAGTKPGAKLPILMWTFGGAFVVGSASDFDGSQLVARSVARGTPIIYVGFNFRLGTIGYPVGEEALKERSLNLGQKDMIAALEWLHENIAVFGGEKRKITMFGESSGAIQISDLYFVNGIERLLAGAILQSGVPGAVPIWNATERPTLWPNFVSNIPSCAHLATSDASQGSAGTKQSTLDCLRKASEEEIKTNYLNPADPTFQGEWWQPTIDSGKGSMMPDFPSRLYERGRFAKIPFIAGNNLDEGTVFAATAREPGYTQTDLRNTLLQPLLSTSLNASKLSETIDRILGLYPNVPTLGSPFGTGNETFGFPSIYKQTSAIQGDLTFTFPLRHWMQAAAERGVEQYGYLFSQHNPLEEPALGVPHGAEIPYVFGNTPDPSAAGQELKTMMMDYWISFTVSSDPNDDKGVKRPRWPRYTKSNQVLIQLDGGNTTTIRDDFRASQNAYLTENAAVFRR